MLELDHILEPIKDLNRTDLCLFAKSLKRHLDGASHWAVGEMLERACAYLDACGYVALAQREANAVWIEYTENTSLERFQNSFEKIMIEAIKFRPPSDGEAR